MLLHSGGPEEPLPAYSGTWISFSSEVSAGTVDTFPIAAFELIMKWQYTFYFGEIGTAMAKVRFPGGNTYGARIWVMFEKDLIHPSSNRR